METSGAATSVMSAPVSPTDSCFPSSPSKFLDQISALFKSGGFLIRFCIYFTEKKRFHLGKHSQIWVGGVSDSQTDPKQNPKSPFLTRISPFVFPNLTKKPWLGSNIWEISEKTFLGTFPKRKCSHLCDHFKFPFPGLQPFKNTR